MFNCLRNDDEYMIIKFGSVGSNDNNNIRIIIIYPGCSMYLYIYLRRRCENLSISRMCRYANGRNFSPRKMCVCVCVFVRVAHSVPHTGK